MNIDDSLRDRLKPFLPDFVAELRAKVAEHCPESAQNRGYSIQNAAGDEAIVRIYDEISWYGINAQDFATEIDAITAPSIRVEINSPGGSVFDGIAIYNSLRLHPAEVTTRIDGIAASIASVIAQAGDHRIMVASSQMMIHNAWGMTVGDSTDHADMATLLAHQDEIIAGIYASRSSQDAEHFMELMSAETWLTDERAVAEGLADEVFTPESAAQNKATPTLAQQIDSLALQAGEALSDVERLVANHGDAGEAMTEAKRQALVALRDVGVRASGLLPEADESQESIDAWLAEKKLALAKRENEWRASLPASLLG